MTETKTRARPAAVTLTPNAEERIARLMASAPEGAIGVRLSTPRRGCSGLAYSVDYVTEEAKFDDKIETPGGTFYIDGASVLYLIARRDRLFRDPPTAAETRLALIDQSVPTLVFLVSIPVAVLVSGGAGRLCWFSLIVLGPIVGRGIDRQRRQQRQMLGLTDDGD